MRTLPLIPTREFKLGSKDHLSKATDDFMGQGANLTRLSLYPDGLVKISADPKIGPQHDGSFEVLKVTKIGSDIYLTVQAGFRIQTGHVPGLRQLLDAILDDKSELVLMGIIDTTLDQREVFELDNTDASLINNLKDIQIIPNDKIKTLGQDGKIKVFQTTQDFAVHKKGEILVVDETALALLRSKDLKLTPVFALEGYVVTYDQDATLLDNRGEFGEAVIPSLDPDFDVKLKSTHLGTDQEAFEAEFV